MVELIEAVLRPERFEGVPVMTRHRWFPMALSVECFVPGFEPLGLYGTCPHWRVDVTRSDEAAGDGDDQSPLGVDSQ